MNEQLFAKICGKFEGILGSLHDVHTPPINAYNNALEILTKKNVNFLFLYLRVNGVSPESQWCFTFCCLIISIYSRKVSVHLWVLK